MDDWFPELIFICPVCELPHDDGQIYCPPPHQRQERPEDTNEEGGSE